MSVRSGQGHCRGDAASDVGFFASDGRPAGAVFARTEALATRAGVDATRSARWAVVWMVLLAVSSWREDQAELEEAITSPQGQSLLVS